MPLGAVTPIKLLKMSQNDKEKIGKRQLKNENTLTQRIIRNGAKNENKNKERRRKTNRET